GACACAGTVRLDRVRGGRPCTWRPTQAGWRARQRRVLDPPRLCAATRHDDGPFLEGTGRGRRVAQAADLLAAPAGAAMKLAVAKYRIQAPGSFDAFATRLRALLAEPARAGARVAVLPEFLSLELAAMQPAGLRAD